MSIGPSNSSNNSGLLGTLRRFSISKRFSQNRFSSNPENNVTQKTEFIFNTGTLKRSLNNAEESSQSRNYTQTLGRPKKFEKPLFESALDQAKKGFWDDGISNEYTNVSEKSHTQNISFIKTIKRRLSAYHLVNLKKPEKINKCLEEAKKSFQESKYKESKKLFKNLLESEHLDTLEKRSEVSLYLAAIYLLEQNGSKAKKYLKEDMDPFLCLVMGLHIQHLIGQYTAYLVDSEHKVISFPNASCYENLLESTTIDEKEIAKKLFESFGKNTSA